MKKTQRFCLIDPIAQAILFCCILLLPGLARAGEATPRPAAGLTGVTVQGMFGGQIFGFDIDSTGTEGVLCEETGELAAVETFDQKTGKILKVLAQMKVGQGSDFITLGVVGNSVGLVEREVAHRDFHKNTRSFSTIIPLAKNRLNGLWTPPLDATQIVSKVSRNQGTPNIAVLTDIISGNSTPTIFSSNVGANTSGPVITLTDEEFVFGSPALAYDPVKNRAILGAETLGSPFVPGKIATVDLVSGLFTKFTGVGDGLVQGIAYDPVSGTLCTTTDTDFSVEFYNLDAQTGFAEPLPNTADQINHGSDVEFDPVNRLFLVAQAHSTLIESGSAIHVYDLAGNLVESISGFNFSDGNVIPTHIALNPAARLGFVDDTSAPVAQIQSFTY